MKSDEWAEKIRQEEGEDVEIIVGVYKKDNLDVHVNCKLGTLVEFVKEMGKIAGDSQPAIPPSFIRNAESALRRIN